MQTVPSKQSLEFWQFWRHAKTEADVSFEQRLTFEQANPIGHVWDETHDDAQMPPFAGSGDSTQTPVSHWSAVTHFAAMGSLEQEEEKKREEMRNATTEAQKHRDLREQKITRRPFSF